MKIKISFILPGYNVENYVLECIESILRQPIENIEIIYVDDKSTDKTLQICELFARKDQRVKVVVHEKNKGSYAARNTGLSLASGEWVVFIDPDDLVSPNFFSAIQPTLENSESDLVVYNYESFNDGGRLPSVDYSESTHFASQADLLNLKAFAWLKLIKRSFLIQSGIRFYEGKTMWDILFHWQVVLACKSPIYLDQKLLWYRQRSSASSYRVDWYRAEGFEVMYQLHEWLCAKEITPEINAIFYKQELNLYCDIRLAFFMNYSLEKRADEIIKKRLTASHWDLISRGALASGRGRDYLLTCCRPSGIKWTCALILPALRYYVYRCARVLKLSLKL